MGKDLRFGIRMLAKSPAFTLMAAVALALGIGANTAIFSVVNAVMLQRMPFQNPDRLVMVWEVNPRNRTNVINPTNFLEWRGRNHSFERIAALIQFDASLTGGGDPEVASNLAVSDGFFEILGVQPILGRWFTADEDTQGKDNVVILSEGMWRRRYGADPNILGRTVEVNGHQLKIVGVMPASFRFPLTKADLWQPLALVPGKQYPGRYLSSVARLRSDATLASARSDMDVLAGQLREERPNYNSHWGAAVIGLREQAIGDVRTPLLVLLGAVGLVLLIACANVANLMLMRAAGRGREVAIRTALGASAGRIVRQLLIESSLLALLGGALGLCIGIAAMGLLSAALPDTITYANLKTVHLDATVFGFALAISLASGILFGLAPSLKAARADVQESLRDGGRGVAGRRSFTRQALVVAEVALSMILLAGAGLLIRSFSRLSSVDPGFDARHVLSMQVAVQGRYGGEKLVQFDQAMLERVRALPGVEAAGTSHFLPLGRIIPGTGFWRADRPKPAPGTGTATDVLVVSPGYFAAMNIPIARGRVFDDRDRSGAPHAVVINQTTARQMFPNEDPVGKILGIEWGDFPYQIIGVVNDVHQRSLGGDVRFQVFISNYQEPTSPVYVVARAHGDPRLLGNAIQAAIHGVDNALPISDVKTMDEYVSEAVAAPRFNTILLGGFAALALVLASVGIFGVISYSVSQRRQEIGIRRALGASAGNVVKLVVGQGMLLAALGIAIGTGGALALARLLQTLLFGTAPTDPATFSVVAALLAGVAFAASYLPARRAARVDPADALRHE